MKPVNLIPPEERRGASAPTRTGNAVYFVVGGLALVLVAVTAMVFFGNQLSDKQTEADTLEAQATEAEARAQSLASYVSFQEMKDQRVQTIDSLAKSRFDWERVIRELSVVIPKGVWLQNLTGTVSPDVQIDDSAGISIRTDIPGPALELVGCARSQPEIAKLIAAMYDIDGITRVTAANGIKSDTPDDSSGSGGNSEGPNTDAGCPKSAPAFQLVAAFDAVVVPDTGGSSVPSGDSAATPASTDESTGNSASDATAVEGTNEQQNASEAQSKAKKAANLVPGK
jgi:Tfp pilus assembly protein PilN